MFKVNNFSIFLLGDNLFSFACFGKNSVSEICLSIKLMFL